MQSRLKLVPGLLKLFNLKFIEILSKFFTQSRFNFTPGQHKTK